MLLDVAARPRLRHWKIFRLANVDRFGNAFRFRRAADAHFHGVKSHVAVHSVNERVGDTIDWDATVLVSIIDGVGKFTYWASIVDGCQE